MYGCESWTIKKAECRRIDAFELWCWRRLLRVPWTVRRSNQSILKEISPGCSLEGLMLKLKLQYFGHLMQRADSLSSVAQLCLTLCDPMDHSTSGLPVHHHPRSLLKLMSIESAMPSNHLILCCPLLLLPSVFPSIRVFSDESALCTLCTNNSL